MQSKEAQPTTWIDVGRVHLDAEIWLLPAERVVPAGHRLWGGSSCRVPHPQPGCISAVFAEYMDGRCFDLLRIFKAHMRQTPGWVERSQLFFHKPGRNDSVRFHGIGKSMFTVSGFFPVSSQNWRCKPGCLSTALQLWLQWRQLLCQIFIPTQLQA